LNAFVIDLAPKDRAEIDSVFGRTSDPIKAILVFDDASFAHVALLVDIDKVTD